MIVVLRSRPYFQPPEKLAVPTEQLQPLAAASALISMLLLSDPWIRSKKIFQRLDPPAHIPEAANWQLTDVFCWDYVFFFLEMK